jgi:hypothetical protein
MTPTREHLKRQVDDAYASRFSHVPAAIIKMWDDKVAEARDILDKADVNGDGNLDPSEVEAILRTSEPQIRQNWPLLSACVGLDGETILHVAKVIMAKSIEGRAKSYALERVRRTATNGIEKALSDEAAIEVFKAIEWPGG